MLKKIALLTIDPQFNFKKRACDFLNIETVSVEDADIIDLSFLLHTNDNIRNYMRLDSKLLLSPAILSELNKSFIIQNQDKILIDLSLREWALVRKIVKMKNDNMCGELTSLRITWTRPAQKSSSEYEFLFNTIPKLIDVACFITEKALRQLYIEKVENQNNLFCILMFDREIVAEIEANEALPNSIEGTHFIKANFTEGIITNVPLVGHFNEEGSIFATNEKCIRYIVEDNEWDGYDEIENTYWQMLLSIKNGNYHTNIKKCCILVDAIRNSITTGHPVNLPYNC